MSLPAKRRPTEPARRGKAGVPAVVPQPTTPAHPAKPRRTWSARSAVVSGILAVLILVGGVGGWAATAQISGAVIAGGQIEVDQNRQVVQHPDGGIVDEIYVREGDKVAEGDLLIKLDQTNIASDLAVVEGQLFEIVARRGRYEAEQSGADTINFDPLLTETDNPKAAELMAGQVALFKARQATETNQKEQLARQRDQIGSQIDGIRAQQAAIQTQLTLIDEELTSQQSLLQRGLAQAARVLDLARAKANAEGQVGELVASAAEAEGKITEIDLAILKIDSDRREEAITRLRDLQYNEIELTEKRRTLKAQLDRTEIRAPVSGVVYGLTVFAPRSVIKPADPILYLVPQDRPLVITARVQTKDIDQLYIDQQVSLRFSAFDQRTTPELFGHVVRISADAFTDQQTRASFYRVEIVLNDGEAARLPDGKTLVPGMPVEAFMRTEERSPAQYFLKPVSDFFAKAFRET